MDRLNSTNLISEGQQRLKATIDGEEVMLIEKAKNQKIVGYYERMNGTKIETVIVEDRPIYEKYSQEQS